jgi:membrane-associated phospholipid phosphatase
VPFYFLSFKVLEETSMLKRLVHIVVLATGVTLPHCLYADVIVDWNNVLLTTIRDTSLNPPRASRAMAMMHTAMYDAVNSIADTHQPYHINVTTDPATSREAAAAQAAHRVLSGLFPARQAIYDSALANHLSSVGDGPNKAAGIDLGNTVADGILSLRSNDHSDYVTPYTPGSDMGDWVPTPPAYAPPLLPNWPALTPFAMTSGDQFRNPNGPPELTSAEFTAAFNEVKSMGSATSAMRTADQTDIAYFWADNAGTSTPPGHWNRIAQEVAQTQGNTLEENARMFALLGISLADAAIVAWDNKFAYNDWRPVTAIRSGDLDGNPDTEADANWSSLIVTPPFPSYTSGHSTFSGAAAALLAGFYGTDDISFTDSAEGFSVADRSFSSFSQASTEAMNSRLYGGIHWRYDNEDGLAGGTALGNYVYATMLRPVPEPGTAGLLAVAVFATSAMIRKRRTCR